MIDIACDNCDFEREVDDNYQGTKQKCPKCKTPILVPAFSPEKLRAIAKERDRKNQANQLREYLDNQSEHGELLKRIARSVSTVAAYVSISFWLWIILSIVSCAAKLPDYR